MIVVLEPERLESVRVREGFSHRSCWHKSVQPRPAKFKALHNRPGSQEGLTGV